jgi:hypothetical protein
MLRRVILPVLALLLLAGSAVPAFATRRLHARRPPRVTLSYEGQGSLIAVSYRGHTGRCVRFFHTSAAIDRVAITDIDNDGDFDIVAAPHDGALLLWRNAGHGRFSLAAQPRRPPRVSPQGLRFVRVVPADDGWQWGVERYDAAMPRAPAVASAAPVAVVRISPLVPIRPVSLRRSSGRAPPVS